MRCLPRVLRPFTRLQMAFQEFRRRNPPTVEEEDSLRFIDIAFPIVRFDPETKQKGYYEFRKIERAKFDKGYTSDVGILMSESVLDGLQLDWERFETPENPPVKILNADGTIMRLEGQFKVKWWGNDEDRIKKEIFLRPLEPIESLVLVLPREAPCRVVIGLDTIRKNGFDEYRPLSICGTGQGGDPHQPLDVSPGMSVDPCC